MPRNLTMPWDVSVPTDRIVPFLTAAEESVSRIAPAAICYAVGHVGDGNIHYSVFPSEDTPEDAISRIYDRIDEIIWTMGGSVVAEHGVGSIFVDRVKAQKSDVEYEMMQSVKQVFDPKSILNPGKLLRAP